MLRGIGIVCGEGLGINTTKKRWSTCSFSCREQKLCFLVHILLSGDLRKFLPQKLKLQLLLQ